MRLEPHEAVDDVHARALQRPGPADVGPLVEAGLDLDHGDDLLAGLGGVDEGLDDRGVAGRPVQRLLDREDLRVGRRLLDEALDARGERLVGVVDHDVALAQRREHALRRLALAERGVRRGDDHRVLELRPVEGQQLGQRGEVEQARDLHDVVRVDLELAQQQVEHVLAHGVDDLQAHRRPEAAAGQLALERLQEVLVAVLLDVEVGVAGHPEHVVLGDGHALEEAVEVLGDEVLDGEEPHLVVEVDPAGTRAVVDGRLAGRLGADPDQARDVVGHLDPREVLGAALRVVDGDREVERLVGDVGEGVRRVHRERGEHREDLRVEPRAEPATGRPSALSGLRGHAGRGGLSTDEIMALTRGEK